MKQHASEAGAVRQHPASRQRRDADVCGLFGIAVMVITYSGQGNGSTAIACAIYLAARVLYVPAYVFGWVPWRSLIWAIGFTATLYLLLSALM